jgi:uracil-DNA glycosylase
MAAAAEPQKHLEQHVARLRNCRRCPLTHRPPVSGGPVLICFAAVCRCFLGKAPGGSDRVPDPQEIANCSSWLDREIEILRPHLVIPVGRLAVERFILVTKLQEIIDRSFRERCLPLRVRLPARPHSWWMTICQMSCDCR